jgi:hypothetical protein
MHMHWMHKGCMQDTFHLCAAGCTDLQPHPPSHMQDTLLHTTHPAAALMLCCPARHKKEGLGTGRHYLDERWVKARGLQGWVIQVATPREALQGSSTQVHATVRGPTTARHSTAQLCTLHHTPKPSNSSLSTGQLPRTADSTGHKHSTAQSWVNLRLLATPCTTAAQSLEVGHST